MGYLWGEVGVGGEAAARERGLPGVLMMLCWQPE